MKNKILKYTQLLLLLLFILPGCNKEEEFLSILPKGIAIAKTTSDFRKLLDAADNDKGYTHSLSQTIAMVDVLTDDVSIDSTYWSRWTSTKMHFQGLFTFDEYVWNYEGLKDDFNWKSPYYVGSLTSIILEEIEKLEDDDIKAQLIAETKVHRAYAYLALVNCYAKAYDPATASTDLGVPIVTKPATLPSLERRSIQEVYEFILNDLLEAVDDLPDDVDRYTHRPTKTSTYAILARTYLYMGDYENALFYADKSLQIHDFLYDLNTQYSGDYPYYTAITKTSRMFDEEILLHKTTPKAIYTYTYMYIDTTTFNQIYPGYDRSGTDYINYDLRRTLWFSGWNTTTTSKLSSNGYSFIYYGNHPSYRYGTDGANSNSAYNTPVTSPEMYLTRAECNARLGHLQDALDDINLLAAKRYKTGTYTDITLTDLGNNQEAVIDAVLKERRRELYGKELRLFDIKRLHLPMTHYLSSLKINVPADDPRLILPIWPGYIEMNLELEENDRTTSGVTYE